jgi:CxxC-x17-CxxC domain-containing protein
MSFQGKSIQCSDCGSTFVLSADEQEQFAARGYSNEPKRCQPCRQARKAQQNISSGNSNSGYQRREMFSAKRADCGKDTQVPFEPHEGRPVYCSDCYRKVKR